MKIGRRIREEFDKMPKNCTIAWFAKELHCERRNVYRIFERENIDIMLLARISRILNHNFFQDLSDQWQNSEEEEATQETAETL